MMMVKVDLGVLNIFDVDLVISFTRIDSFDSWGFENICKVGSIL